MSLKFRSPWIFMAAASLLVATVATAQNNPATQKDQAKRSDALQKRQTQPTRQPTIQTTRKVPSQTSSRGDAQLAACLIIENNNEAALGQFATQKAKNPEVKDFAQRMVNDHEQFASQLQKFASAGGIEIKKPAGVGAGDNRSQRSERRSSERDADANQSTTQRGEETAQSTKRTSQASATEQGQGLDFVAIKQEIADRCLASIKQALEEKQPEKFDKCYVGGQVMAHMAMVDALEVLKNHASSELSPVLEDGLKTAQAHLDEAKRLEKTLESERSQQK